VSYRHLVHVVSLILLALSAALAVTFLVALAYGEGDASAFLISSALLVIIGLLGFWQTRLHRDLSVREGYAVVSLSWMAVGVAGALPYILSGSIERPVAALFESVSGFTTTGATVFTDIEALPHGILFWRSLTQWLGGMGIIVLGVAILPFLGVGGMQLFRAEVPGPTPERLQPRIAHTAKLLWLVYGALTAAQAGLYLLGGMEPFDAVTHSFTTLSTGGFSPRNASLAAYPSPFIQYVTIIFMYLAGINFTLHYRAATGRPSVYLHDREWRFFTLLAVGATALVLLLTVAGGMYDDTGFERGLRDSLFQVASIITTTGFVSTDYGLWPIGAQFVLLLLMFVGGMAGSTAGGIKALRFYVLARQTLSELKKSLHPRGVILTRVGDEVVKEDVLARILIFVIVYLTLFALGTLIMTILGHDLTTSIGSSAASLGNIGPGLGEVGAVDNYGWLDPISQLTLLLLMLIGRLEIFTILLLLHPGLWRRSRSRHRVTEPAPIPHFPFRGQGRR
jgi:trk system potassium uptake protein TrkH